MIKERIQLDELGIDYIRAGNSGDPVILLHGGGADSALLSWRLTIPLLAQHRRVYAPDWPGYSGSTPLQGACTQEALTACLQQLLDAWKLERVSLMGISMGGGVALGYAIANPERVDKLVLVDSYGLQEKMPFHKLSYLFLQMPFLNKLAWAGMRRSRSLVRKGLYNIFYNMKVVNEALVEEVFESIRDSCVDDVFHSWQRSEIQWNGLKTCYLDQLDRLRVKTLIVHGEYDSLVPLVYARRAAQQIADAQLAVITDCGHWPQRECPEIFKQMITPFLFR